MEEGWCEFKKPSQVNRPRWGNRKKHERCGNYRNTNYARRPKRRNLNTINGKTRWCLGPRGLYFNDPPAMRRLWNKVWHRQACRQPDFPVTA